MNFMEGLKSILGGGWDSSVQRAGVRPDYGLSSVTGVSPTAKSPYERTLRPDETRTPEEVRDMLGEVILAAGSGGIGSGMTTGRGNRPIRRRPDSGMVSQIKAEREMARLRAEMDDAVYGYKSGDRSVPPIFTGVTHESLQRLGPKLPEYLLRIKQGFDPVRTFHEMMDKP